MTAHAVEYMDPRTDRRPPSSHPYRNFDRPNLSIVAIQKSDDATENLEDINVWVAGAQSRIHAFDRFIAWFSDSRTDTGEADRREEIDTYHLTPSRLPAELEAVLEEFTAGIGEVRPAEAVVEAARAISLAAVKYTTEPEIAVDIDGELSFDLRLANGRLVLAELNVNGRVHVGVHDENDQLEEHRTTDCRYLLSMIEP